MIPSVVKILELVAEELWKKARDLKKQRVTLWLVGQLRGDWKETGSVWEFQGVFAEQRQAALACRNENYFMYSVTLNDELPDAPCLPRADIRWPAREICNGLPNIPSIPPVPAPKKVDLFEFILSHNHDPLACLQKLDGSPRAMRVWRWAVRTNATYVHTLLCDMVSSREGWDSIQNPAALCMARCMSLAEHPWLGDEEAPVR